MGLLNNGYRHALTGRMFGLTAIDGAYAASAPLRWDRSAARRNMTVGEGMNAPQASVPSGARAPYAWVTPREGGATKSFRRCNISVSASAEGTRGLVRSATADISVDASASVDGVVSASASCNINVGMTAEIGGVINGTSTASVSVGLTASLDGDAFLTASLPVSVVATASPIGEGIITSSTDYAEEALTAQGVVDAIMSRVVDGGYTLEELTQIVAAVLAGKTQIVDTGAGTATVTFRDLGDTTDRVVVDMDGSERVAVGITV